MTADACHPAIECRGVSRTFGRGDSAIAVLRDVTLSLAPGECLALLGPSGSGKTTLLSIMGCMLTPSEGEVLMAGRRIDYARRDRLTSIRRSRVGYVFQHSRLLPFLSVRENLLVVGRNAGVASRLLEERIRRLASELGVDHRLRQRAELLSGGERQRVAVARALLHAPDVILADEPTGALDAEQGRNVARKLTQQARKSRAALVVVTHDARIMDCFDRVSHIDSGRISA